MTKLIKSGNLDDRLVNIEEVIEELQNKKSGSGGMSKGEVLETNSRISELEDQVSALQAQVIKLQPE